VQTYSENNNRLDCLYSPFSQRDRHHPRFAQNHVVAIPFSQFSNSSNGANALRFRHVPCRRRAQQAGGSRISIRNPSRRPHGHRSRTYDPPTRCSNPPNPPPGRKIPLGLHSLEVIRKRLRSSEISVATDAPECIRGWCRKELVFSPRPPLSYPSLTIECIRVTGLSSLCASLCSSRRRIFYDDPLFRRTPRHQILITDSLTNSQSIILCKILINISLCAICKILPHNFHLHTKEHLLLFYKERSIASLPKEPR